MEFNLDLIDPDTGEKKTITYSTKDSSLRELNGELMELHNTSIVTDKLTKRLTISLGFACNFRCDYCLQAHTKLKQPDPIKVKELIEELKAMNLEHTKVEFWGGEPLLYYDTIVEISSELKDKVGSFLIITNGSLLTKEKAMVLLGLGFSIAISYDCQNQEKLRGKDPLKTNPELFRWLLTTYPERTSLNTVMTDTNYITTERLDWIEKILGTRDVNIGGEGFVVDYHNTIEMTKPDVYKDLVLGEGFKNGYYSAIIGGFIKSIVNGRAISDIKSGCSVGTDRYMIKSLEGRDLTCHNFLNNFVPNTLHTRSKCKECLVAHLCKGQCPAIKEDTPQFKKNCELNKHIFTQILRVSIWILTNYKYQVYNIREDKGV